MGHAAATEASAGRSKVLRELLPITDDELEQAIMRQNPKKAPG